MAREVTVRMKLKAGAEGLEKFAQVGNILTGIKSGMEIAEKAGKALERAFELTVGRALEFRSTADQGRQALDGFATQATKAQVAIGDALLPALQGYAEALGPVIDETTAWINENRALLADDITGFLREAATLLVDGVAVGASITTTSFAGLRIAIKGVELAWLDLKAAHYGVQASTKEIVESTLDAVGAERKAAAAASEAFTFRSKQKKAEQEAAAIRREILKIDDDEATLQGRLAELHEKAIEIVDRGAAAAAKAARERVQHTRIVSDAQKKAEDDARKADEAELKAKAEQEKSDREYVEEQERIAKETEDRQNAMRIATAEADEAWRLARKNQEDRAAEENELRFQGELAAFQKMQDGKAKALEREKAVAAEVASTAADLTQEFIANARGADGFSGAIENLVSHIGEMLLTGGINLLFNLLTGGIAGVIGGGGIAGAIFGAIAGHNTGGTVHAFAGGGTVPGFGLADTVPAILTPGEVVVSRSGVRQASRGEMPDELGGGRSRSRAVGLTVIVQNRSPVPRSAQLANDVERELGPALRRKVRKF